MDQPMPTELLAALNGESKDFAVKARFAVPRSNAIGLVVMGLLWSAFISIFWIAFFGPVFQGKQVHFTSNGVATVAGPGHMGPLLMPGIIVGVFTLIGLGLIAGGLRAMQEPGPWFAGTASRLIVLSKGTFQSIDWENFTGMMQVAGPADNAEITLELRTGHMVSQKNGPSRYVPDKICIVGIANAFAIEEMCRKRIKENDPTPPSTEARRA
jgi:hypothetical protein